MRCEIKSNNAVTTILFMVILILFDKFRKKKVCMTIIAKFVNEEQFFSLMFYFSE